MGTRNNIARQRSTAFSHPYTNPASDQSGFVVKEADAAAMSSGVSGKTVAVLTAQGFTQAFLDKFKATNTVIKVDTAAEQWAKLKAGTVQAVFTGMVEHKKFASENAGYKIVNLQSFSKGVSFACRPEFGDVLATINAGMDKVKADTAYWNALCAKYSTVECDKASTKYNNVLPESEHLHHRAEIVLMTEADWGNHNKIAKNGSLVGFDIDFSREVCKAANVKCSIITAPWQSVWPKSWPEFGMKNNKGNYPGWGIDSKWFHCSMGTRNTIDRQQSTAFTYSYTDLSFDKTVFVVKKKQLCQPTGMARKLVFLQPKASQIISKQMRKPGGRL